MRNNIKNHAILPGTVVLVVRTVVVFVSVLAAVVFGGMVGLILVTFVVGKTAVLVFGLIFVTFVVGKTAVLVFGLIFATFVVTGATLAVLVVV